MDNLLRDDKGALFSYKRTKELWELIKMLYKSDYKMLMEAENMKGKFRKVIRTMKHYNPDFNQYEDFQG